MDVDKKMRLQVRGGPDLDMPLRVLNLVSQLGITADRILIERHNGGQIIEALLNASNERASLLVEKLRSMVLIESAGLFDQLDGILD